MVADRETEHEASLLLYVASTGYVAVVFKANSPVRWVKHRVLAKSDELHLGGLRLAITIFRPRERRVRLYDGVRK